MTFKPGKGAAVDPAGTALLEEMKQLARKASKDKQFIVQVRVAPKDKAPHHSCSCCCS